MLRGACSAASWQYFGPMNLRNPWLLLFLTFALAVAAQLLLPWWSLALVAAGVGFTLAQSGKAAFGVGFGAAGLSWLLPALWLNAANDSLLASRMAGLLPLGGSAAALVLLTAVLGGLVGGVAALAGCWLRVALAPPAALN
jgi:hypothetical protein